MRGFGAWIYIAQKQSHEHSHKACHVQHIQQYMPAAGFVRHSLANMLRPSTQASTALFAHYLAGCSAAHTIIARGNAESTAVSDRQINKAGTICCATAGAAV